MKVTSRSRRRVMRHFGWVGLAGLLARAGHALAQAPAWNRAAFEAKALDDVLKALGAGARAGVSREVVLTAPDMAEDGRSVRVEASTTAAGARRLLLLADKNPNLLVAVFDLSDAIEPAVAVTIKLAESSLVRAVVLTADQRVLMATKDVRVTLGGCG